LSNLNSYTGGSIAPLVDCQSGVVVTKGTSLRYVSLRDGLSSALDNKWAMEPQNPRLTRPDKKNRPLCLRSLWFRTEDLYHFSNFIIAIFGLPDVFYDIFCHP